MVLNPYLYINDRAFYDHGVIDSSCWDNRLNSGLFKGIGVPDDKLLYNWFQMYKKSERPRSEDGIRDRIDIDNIYADYIPCPTSCPGSISDASPSLGILI